MPTFHIKAIKSSGETYEDNITATDKFSANEKLVSTGDNVISIRENKERDWRSFLKKSVNFLGGIKEHEIIVFSKNLGLMIQAGLSLSRAISVIERQTKNRKLKTTLSSIRDGITRGDSFHESLKQYPNVFSRLFVSMVAAGEESGNLAETLKTISKQMERTYIIKKKIRGAMIYPAIVMSLIVVIGIMMLIFIVPTLTATFNELGVELPISTRIIIGISSLMRDHALLVFGSILVLVIVIFYALKTRYGKRIFEFTVLHAPVVAPIVKEVNASRTARTLSSLLKAGVDYVIAIQITRDVLQNSYYKEVMFEAEKKVQKGEPISKVFLSHERLYPIFVGEMAAVGEETGDISEMFSSVASFYEEDVQERTKNMSTLIEPFLMIIIGVAVGFFAISMLSPTYSLVDAI